MQNATIKLWKYTGELTTATECETRMPIDVSSVTKEWHNRVNEVLSEAGISIPADVIMKDGGRQGRHTEHLQKLLEEMQYMQRTYPGVEW
jgi:ring-1,2-phenylacetyl-CoA epoxidase subunit PaaC